MTAFPASRRLARLAAVQALYQMEMTRADAADVIAEFAAHRFDKLPQSEPPVEVDEEHFRAVVLGVVAHQREIDRHTNKLLEKSWTLDRVDSTLRAILRAAGFELSEMKDIPHAVVINEYLEIAHSFFERSEIAFLNGVLDHLARDLRPESF